MTLSGTRINEYKQLQLSDDIIWQIGYYFLEYLKNGNRYQDFDMLLACVPKEFIKQTLKTSDC